MVKEVLKLFGKEILTSRCIYGKVLEVLNIFQKELLILRFIDNKVKFKVSSY